MGLPCRQAAPAMLTLPRASASSRRPSCETSRHVLLQQLGQLEMQTLAALAAVLLVTASGAMCPGHTAAGRLQTMPELLLRQLVSPMVLKQHVCRGCAAATGVDTAPLGAPWPAAG